MADIEFPTTPGSLIRATSRRTTPNLYMLISIPGGQPVWVHENGNWYTRPELVLMAVVHDEGRALLLANLPDWDDLTDVDKGCALMYAWKVENEGHEYAVDNYPAKFVDHPVLVRLTDRESCDYVDGMGFCLSWADKVTRGEDSMTWDEYQHLYEIGLDADRS